MSEKFYITTSIPYVNSVPHVGFAMELVQADVLARYQRLLGKNVFFLTGTDEHGLKIAEAAEKLEITPQELCDKNSAEFLKLAEQIGASNDGFIRTTDQKHLDFVVDIWKKFAGKGDLEFRNYEGLYCVGCEKFVQEKDLINGLCPDHMQEPKKVTEENYFFKLSKYREQIRKLIASDELRIVPESKKKEILNMLADSVDDVSFSRSVESYKWGIPVPGDAKQLMYVWPDALSNYMSGVDQKKYWPADVHLVGKDILKFHAIYWIGMLLSAGYAIPKSIMVHGHITSEGKKMSKTLGNVKDPFEYIEKYGKDALRYFLIREIPTLDDGDFSQDRFESVYNDELANTFGNLVSRVVAMNKKYFEGVVPKQGDDDGFAKIVEKSWENFHSCFLDFDLKKAAEEIVKLGMLANKYVDDKKPWALAKEGHTEVLAGVLYNLLEVIRQIALMLYAIIPDSALRILRVFEQELIVEDLRFEYLMKWGGLKEGQKIGEAGIMFPKIEK
jgi:methionyl-tRNA synthetase